MAEFSFNAAGQGSTVFQKNEGQAWLSSLCGMACGDDTGPTRAQGLAIISTSRGRFEAGGLALVQATFDDGHVVLVWQAADGTVQLESRWAFSPETGIWSRKDTLTNRGSAALTVYRCQARFVFAPARYEVYAQDSRWSTENQGAWTTLHAGSLVLGCEWGRPTQGGTPYACLRQVGGETGVAFHILPCGNWAIHLSAHAVMNGLPYAVVELGLAGEDLRLELQPGEAFALPEILIQAVLHGQPHLGAPQLHRYIQSAFLSTGKPEVPVVYNTWFDQFEILDIPRLRRQLAAAREIGCEVFVVDAGWYGPGGPHWWLQTGDWREKTDAAFHGRMAEFAQEVRAAGLGFGLWMEPERFNLTTPIYQEHPEWFVLADGPVARIDLENPAAYAYQKAEISRLVETYDLAWMKVDFNFSLGYDARGAELARYYAAWYRLVDEIRAKYPRTFFEGCSSGGMRSDLHTIIHFDGHFLTDTVNPVDLLRITEGALLRLPPGRLTKWATLRSIGQTIPRYTKSLEESPIAVVTPGGAGWEPSETTDVSFTALVSLLGMLGLSGDMASLPPEARQSLKQHIVFFKEWRRFIVGSIAHLLTPPRPIQDRTGWAAVQLQHPRQTAQLVFAYRLVDARHRYAFCLRDLDPDTVYSVRQAVASDAPVVKRTGKELMADGLVAEAPGFNTGAVYLVQPE
jgi:alpha-galactosidase